MKTEITVRYNGFNVSTDLAPRITSIEYIDNISIFADSIAIDLENVDGFFYSNANRPLKGDIVEVQIDDLICGAFELDEPEFMMYPESHVILKGQSARISSTKMLSKISRYYEDISLFSIIKEMANILKLQPSFFCEDVTIARKSFFNQTPMQIVASFCDQYGYNYKVTTRVDKYGLNQRYKLIISDKLDNRVQTQTNELVIDKNERTAIDDLSIVDKSRNVTRKRVYVRDPNNRKLNQFFETNFDPSLGNEVEDTQTFQGQFSGDEMARIAKTLQRQEKLVGNFTMQGVSSALAGAILRIANYSEYLDGKYIIKKATHIYSANNGWTVSGEFYNAS